MVIETSSDTVNSNRTCSTCDHSGPADDFYESTPECRKCKRTRSRLNRAVIAEKVALAERFLDLVERIADGDKRQLCLSCAGPTIGQVEQ